MVKRPARRDNTTHHANDFSAATVADESLLDKIKNNHDRESVRRALLNAASLSERKGIRRRVRRAIRKRTSIADAIRTSPNHNHTLRPLELAYYRWNSSPSNDNFRELTETIDHQLQQGHTTLACAEAYLLQLTNDKYELGVALRVWFVRARIDKARQLSVSLALKTTQNLERRNERLLALRRRMVFAMRGALEKRRAQVSDFELRIRDRWTFVPEQIIRRLEARTPDVRFACELRSKDYELIQEWNNGEPLRDKRDMLEWARRGEKAAVRYYKNARRSVRDVSVQQLLEGSDDEWRSHDLNVDDRHLDVKNIRCRREDRFGEHFLRRYKRTTSGEDIGIVGVVSMLSENDSMVVGEVTRADVSCLYDAIREASEESNLAICVDRERDWRERVPGWMFEYPDYHYSNMPDWTLIVDIYRMVTAAFGLPMPRWVTGIAAAHGSVASDERESEEIVCCLRRFFGHYGLSRRTLFWFVLIRMLSSDALDPRKEIEEHLFLDGNAARSYPLGRFDPREYTWNLMEALENLLTSNSDLRQRASNFQLVGLNILKAKLGEQWQTVLAYCGKCGRWPLYLGRSEACQCGRGRLLCDECGDCGVDSCPGKVVGEERLRT